MKISGSSSSFSNSKVDVLVVPVFKEDKAASGPLKELDIMSGGAITSLFKMGEVKGGAGETHFLHIKAPVKGGAGRLLLVGAGSKAEYSAASVAVATGTAARAINKRGLSSLAIDIRSKGDVPTAVAAAAQGAVCSLFELDKYRTSDKIKTKLTQVVIFSEDARAADLKSGIAKGIVIGDSMNFARDLANEPPNILTPTEMALRAKKMARLAGLKCEILDEAQMSRLGMGSLLSVSKGSEQPAKLIVLKYEPKKRVKNGDLLALVGKGITFDTGGISLKPGDGMEAMKYDMSGGASVLGTMRAVGLLKPDVPVLGVVAAVENMPDGRATRPSDVVTAMNGKTVEILNTDAEGRLILADAVAYAETKGATKIIDMATLTGAVIIALGDSHTAVLGNDQKLVDSIISSGKEVGEGYWQLPIGPEYSKGIKSDIADIKNIGPARKAGTIMGAVFIEEFVSKAKWAHLDIAGTAWADSERPHQAKGPTAVAIRTLINLIEKS